MNKSNQLNKLLLEVSQSPIIDSGDYKAAAEFVTGIGRKGLNVARCSIWTLDKNITEIDCLMLNHGDHIDYPDSAFSDKEYPAYFDALREKRFIVANDAISDPDTIEFKSYLMEEGIHSILDAPIRKGGVIVGTLCCEHVGPARTWTPEEQSFAGTLADILGRALTAQDRLTAQTHLEDTNRRLSQLIEERNHHLNLAFQQISEQEKMVALGQLVAGIAHEINNPIGLGVTTVTHIQQMTHDISNAFKAGTITQTQFKDFLESIEEGSHLLLENLNRAAELVRSFKQIAVDQSNDSVMEINLGDTLTNIVKSLKPELKKKHQTEINLICPANIRLNSCPGSIAQIMTNLLMNAGIHAFSEDQKDRSIFIEVEPLEDHIQITVEDNGQGISEEVKDSLFEPFVTTRRSKGGSGLGLNIVQNLVTQTLHGTIKLETEAGKFTRFTLTLPNS
ncbi:sensor histidine kinase [Litoribrevibacter albus]|uniref:histidine kinase n=1 Tax=Litoribrevibacter albus TaxID=1473156 RepID=A0AA37SD03_9GAMM|nr:GAF domain-containing sensor histidine kinase [Litoribrevibacter albus]GLQ33189.1 diguanylate cyclase [Litoribrevibacter albus]